MRRTHLAVSAASLAVAGAANAIELFNNGTYLTGTSGAGNAISQIEPGYDTFGIVAGGYNPSFIQRVGDNFLVLDAAWQLQSLTLYAYQSGGVVDPFTSAYVGIYDFDPTQTANETPRYGSVDPFSAPNRFAGQTALNQFRVGANTEDVSRHIHAVTIDLSWLPPLEPGEYWFGVGLRGTGDSSVVATVPVVPTLDTADGLSYGRLRYTPPGREFFWQYADGNIPTGGDPNSIEPYDHAFRLDGTTAALNEWSGPAGGSYNATSGWTGGTVPDGVDVTANFIYNISAPATITVDSPITLGKINFNNTSTYTLAGAATITMQNTSGSQINVLAGSHTISAPLSVSGGLTLGVYDPAGSLEITSGIETTGPVIMRGDGVATVGHVRTDSLQVRGGTLRIAPNGTSTGTSNVRELVFAVGNTPRASIDLTDNALVVDYSGESPYQAVRALIINAYDGGTWAGDGIGSSAADASQFGVGYAEASALGSVPAIFGSVDNDSVLVRFTRYGDANLDGTVNLADFNRLAGNFGSADANWDQGDFNYDGVVNLADFNRLAANFGLSAGPDGPTPEDWSNLAAAVPEPGSLALLGAALLLGARRRR